MKTKKWRMAISLALGMVVLATIAGCAKDRAAAQPTPMAGGQAPQVAIEPQGDARALLMRMADFLSKTPRFSVSIRNGYDVVQKSGQKIEFGEARKLTVSRPDRFRVEVEQSDGDRNMILFDGATITAFSPTQNVYAQVAKPGDIDGALVYFLKDLHMRLPLALLLVSRLPEAIERRTQSVDYVEKTALYGIPAHHLAGRTDTVDYQIWIAEGSQPLPLRVVLTYKNAEGQPQFRAQFSDWNLTPEVAASMFAFTPPQGAHKIAFPAQASQIDLQGAPTPGQTGGQQ
jgi:hypothetical protein